jgi:hypothetical protein
MLRTRNKLGIGLAVSILCSLILLTAGRASEPELAAPPVDPIVGLWNVNLNSSGFPPELVTMTFNQGGTTVEYDTPGVNSFTSPGESLVQGVWKKTGINAYTFKEQNFIFDATGTLFADSLATCQVTLSRDGQSFTATCDLEFFHCTVAQCPGGFIASGPATMTATRFE